MPRPLLVAFRVISSQTDTAFPVLLPFPCCFPFMAFFLQIFFCRCSMCLPLCGFAHTILAVWKVVIPVHPLIPNIINVASSLKPFSPQTHRCHFYSVREVFHLCVLCLPHEITDFLGIATVFRSSFMSTAYHNVLNIVDTQYMLSKCV